MRFWISLTVSFFLFLGATPAPAQFRVIIHHAHPNLDYDENEFRQNMDFLKANGYHTVTPAQLLAWMQSNAALPVRPVLLTVDDNYIMVYTSMFPILRDRGMKIVNFTITNSVGQTSGLAYCSWNQLKEMEASGVVISESHTKTHPQLTQISSTSMRSEVRDSKPAIDTNMGSGKACRFFAYPYGDYNAAVITQVVSAGYSAAFAASQGTTYRNTSIWEIPRNGGDGLDVEGYKNLVGFYDLPPAPPGAGFTLDNGDVHYLEESGSWTPVSGNGCYGATASVCAAAGPGTANARWKVLVPADGAYRVHAWWSAAGDRSAGARYNVRSEDGDASVVADQRTNGSRWNLLGTYMFRTTVAGEVNLDAASAGSLSADGLWFEPVNSSVEDWGVY